MIARALIFTILPVVLFVACGTCLGDEKKYWRAVLFSIIGAANLAILMSVMYDNGLGNPTKPEPSVVYCSAAHLDVDKYLLRDVVKNKMVFVQTNEKIPDSCFVKKSEGDGGEFIVIKPK